MKTRKLGKYFGMNVTMDIYSYMTKDNTINTIREIEKIKNFYLKKNLKEFFKNIAIGDEYIYSIERNAFGKEMNHKVRKIEDNSFAIYGTWQNGCDQNESIWDLKTLVDSVYTERKINFKIDIEQLQNNNDCLHIIEK